MARPVIALLTDFGTRDHYAGTMKGVVLGICPDATLVDITPRHPAARRAGRRRSSWPPCYRYFPAGHDLPRRRRSRASARRGAAIAAEAGDYRFVAPDNGVLTAVFDEHAAEARRRADRARATRGRRSAARSKDAIASRRPRPGWRRASTWRRSAARSARLQRARPAAAAASSADGVDGEVRARRSLRQPDHQHRSHDVRDAARRAARSTSTRRRHRSSGLVVDLRRAPRRRARARCSAAPITSRSPSTAASAADALGAGARRRRARRRRA